MIDLIFICSKTKRKSLFHNGVSFLKRMVGICNEVQKIAETPPERNDSSIGTVVLKRLGVDQFASENILLT